MTKADDKGQTPMEACIDFFQALSDETRQKILLVLEKKETCVGDLVEACGVSQSTVSHHLRILKYARLVESKKMGQQIYYRLRSDWMRACCRDFLGRFDCCADMFKKKKSGKKHSSKKS